MTDLQNMGWDPRIRNCSMQAIGDFLGVDRTIITVSTAKKLLVASGLVWWPKSASYACFLIPPLPPANLRGNSRRKIDPIVVDEE